MNQFFFAPWRLCASASNANAAASRSRLGRAIFRPDYAHDSLAETAERLFKIALLHRHELHEHRRHFVLGLFAAGDPLGWIVWIAKIVGRVVVDRFHDQ